MRNLKRALSLVLAVVMVIGLMVVGASAVSYNDFSDREEIVNKDAVSMLTTLGIIEGQPDGSYNPAGNVDRAQMAKMISVALTNNEDCDTLYQNVNSGLTDITANWARGYINYCYVRGIIAGRGDNTFDPSANVTGVEAAKMLLAALGYNAEIEGLVGPDWALNTAALAQQLGIFRNFTKDVSEPLNRDDAALLIYNALDVELIQEYRNGYAIAYDDHRTILSSVFGVIRVEGVVVGNEWAQLQGTNSDASLREGRTNLENVVWYDSTTANTRVEEGIVVDGIVPFNVSTPVEYIGKAVTLYVEKTTILSNSTVIGVATNDDQNVVLTNVSNEDTSSDYLKGTGVTADNDTEYYVNYGAVESENAAIDLINEHTTYARDGKFDLNGIEVEVIDNDDDGTADYVLYLVETLSEVSRYSERNEELSFYTPYDSDGDLATSSTLVTATRDLADVVYTESVSLGGVVTTDALDLATDDLILYVEYGGRTYVYLPEIVTGTMTRVDRDKDNELYITVDDADEYRQSYIMDAASLVDVDVTRFDITNAKNEPGFDDLYDFILDSNGYVIAIRPAEEKVTNYALVLESAWTQNALTKSGEVKVLMADGTEKTFDINWSESRKVFAYLGTSSTVRDEALEDYLGTRDVLGGQNTGAAIGTVIEYSLNDAGDELTIENIMNLNTLDDNGYTGEAANSDPLEDVDDEDTDIAYIVNNASASMNQNLQYEVRSNYRTGDGTLYLTVKNNNNVDNPNARGDNVAYAIDKDTVAFYYVDSDTYGVATGWDKMSDVDAGAAAQVYPVLQKDGQGGWEATRLADLVLFNSAPTNDSNDYMLVLDANYYRGDELWLNVVFEDGTAAEIQIDDDGNHDFDVEDSYMKAYAYTENADGTYDVSTKAPIGVNDGVLIRRDTVEWGNENYLTIVDSTNVWDVTDVTRADEEVTAGSFTYNDKNAVVVTGGDRGENIRTAWVWDKDEDTTPGHVSGVYDPNLYDVTGNVITIRKYVFDDLSSRDVSKLIGDEMEGMDIERVSIRSGSAPYAYEVTIEETDGYSSIYDVLIEDVRRITYNNRDYFLAQGESIDVNSPVVLSVSTIGGVTTYADASARVSSPNAGEYIYTLNAPVAVGSRTDIVIVDGWKVDGNMHAVVNETSDMVQVGGDYYYAAGETVELTCNVGRTVTVTYGTESKSFTPTTAGQTFNFTMPAADIVVGVDDTPVTVNVLLPNNNDQALTTFGTYHVSTDRLSGETGDQITVTVTQTATGSANGNLTLSVTGTGNSIVGPDGSTGTVATTSGQTGTWTFTLTLGTADAQLSMSASA